MRRMMGKLVHLIIRSCKKATFLMEKEQFGRLNLLERTVLKMHLSLCDYCSNYYRQSHFINRSMAAFLKQDSGKLPILLLPQEVKKRMQEALNREMKKN